LTKTVVFVASAIIQKDGQVACVTKKNDAKKEKAAEIDAITTADHKKLPSVEETSVDNLSNNSSPDGIRHGGSNDPAEIVISFMSMDDTSINCTTIEVAALQKPLANIEVSNDIAEIVFSSFQADNILANYNNTIEVMALRQPARNIEVSNDAIGIVGSSFQEFVARFHNNTIEVMALHSPKNIEVEIHDKTLITAASPLPLSSSSV